MPEGLREILHEIPSRYKDDAERKRLLLGIQPAIDQGIDRTDIIVFLWLLIAIREWIYKAKEERRALRAKALLLVRRDLKDGNSSTPINRNTSRLYNSHGATRIVVPETESNRHLLSEGT